MIDQLPTTETVAPAASAVVPETVVPASEEFDKERAMNTIHALRAIEKQAKQDAKELAEFKADKAKREEAEMTELQKLQKQTAEAQAQNAKLQSDLLRRDVIAETGLPVLFTDRLKGTTKEELLADAAELAKTLPTLKVAPHVNATNPNQANPTETDAQKRDRLFGRQGNPFDLETIKAQGGGVVWNK